VPANALNSLNNRLGRLVGVPLGGVLLATVGLRAVVLVDAVSFLAAASLVIFVAAPARGARLEDADAAARSAWRAFVGDWRDGLALVWNDRSVALIFFVLGLMTFGGTMLDPLHVAWVRDELHGGPEIYSGLSVAHAITGILAGVLIGQFAAHVAPRDLCGWGSIAAGIALLGVTLPQAPTPWIEAPGSYRAHCSPGSAHVLQITARAGAPTPKPSPDPTWGLHLTDANIALGNLVDLVGDQARAFAAR
jgi:MFS family permease